jgi:hypothetical protein
MRSMHDIICQIAARGRAEDARSTEAGGDDGGESSASVVNAPDSSTTHRLQVDSAVFKELG